MDTTTRTAALEKLQAMEASIGHADELLNDEKINDYYSELEINPGIYLKSAFNITRFLENKNYRVLRKLADSDNWIFSKNAAVINAFYILQKNTLGIRLFLIFINFAPILKNCYMFRDTGWIFKIIFSVC